MSSIWRFVSAAQAFDSSRIFLMACVLSFTAPATPLKAAAIAVTPSAIGPPARNDWVRDEPSRVTCPTAPPISEETAEMAPANEEAKTFALFRLAARDEV